jgi:hypothetical protein
MTFSKSNLNLLPESLLTELTADQAQMLEGGKRIEILTIRCINPGDSDRTDEMFFGINGQLFNNKNPFSMKRGTTVSPGVSKTFNSTAKVFLADLNGAVVDQTLGFAFLSDLTNGTVVQVSNAKTGAIYDVAYRITN